MWQKYLAITHYPLLSLFHLLRGKFLCFLAVLNFLRFPHALRSPSLTLKITDMGNT